MLLPNPPLKNSLSKLAASKHFSGFVLDFFLTYKKTDLSTLRCVIFLISDQFLPWVSHPGIRILPKSPTPKPGVTGIDLYGVSLHLKW